MALLVVESAAALVADMAISAFLSENIDILWLYFISLYVFNNFLGLLCILYMFD